MPTNRCILALTALLVAVGCGKKSAPVTGDDPWAGFSFVRHLPAETEAFVFLRHPAETWRAMNWSPLLSDPGLQTWWQETTPGRFANAVATSPQGAPLLQALAELAEYEVFLACGPGTGAQLTSWQKIKRLFEAARLRNLFTPLPADAAPPEELPLEESPEDFSSAAFTEIITPLPPAMQETLEKFVREAAVPPLILGAKIPPDAALPRLLGEWVESLPAKIPRDRVDAGPHGQFVRVRFPLTMVVPTNVAVLARDKLAASIGDPYAATYIVRDLLSKVTTLGFGSMHGYFVMSVGFESGVPATEQESPMVGAPVMRELAPSITGETEAIFYADPLVVSLAAAPPPVSEYLDAATEAALEFAPAETIGPLRTRAEALRKQAAELFRPRTSAVSGQVQRSSDSWRAEMFGGSLAPRLARENASPLFRPNEEIDFAWMENWEQGYARKLTDFAADLSAFAAEWTKALGPVFLDDRRRPATEVFLRLVGEPLEQLGPKAGTLLDRALGSKVGMAMSFDGTMPGPPMLPAAAEKAILPRLALAADLQDRKTLGEEWKKWTESGKGGTWPLPAAAAGNNGTATYEYPLPLGGPDAAIAVTLTDRRWLIGNSRAFNTMVATLPAPSEDASALQIINATTAPLSTFAAAWSQALEAEPGLAAYTGGLIPPDPQTLSALAGILSRPRQFRYVAKWEDDLLHRIMTLEPAP